VLDDIDAFRAWLTKETSLSPPSVSDVCSRLRRLSAMVNLGSTRTAEEIKAVAVRAPLFSTLSPDVRSQLKRAGSLYMEFRARKGRR
jgi:hypothetical protein